MKSFAKVEKCFIIGLDKKAYENTNKSRFVSMRMNFSSSFGAREIFRWYFIVKCPLLLLLYANTNTQ